MHGLLARMNLSGDVDDTGREAPVVTGFRGRLHQMAALLLSGLSKVNKPLFYRKQSLATSCLRLHLRDCRQRKRSFLFEPAHYKRLYMLSRAAVAFGPLHNLSLVQAMSLRVVV